MRSNNPLIYPDGLDAPPVCSSADVVAEYDLRERAVEYMRFSSKERRQGLAGSRSEKVSVITKFDGLLVTLRDGRYGKD
jgi:hypothetical protein